MKKNVTLLFVFTVLFIVFWWTFNFVSREGKFTKTGHAAVKIDNFENGNPVYLGYPFKWNGIGKPTLEKFEFIKSDGKIVAIDDNEFNIHPFIARSERIGALDEESVIKDKLNDDFVRVKSFIVNENFYLVIRVKFIGTNPYNDIRTLRIKYKNFGITQIQNIPFDDGVIIDE